MASCLVEEPPGIPWEPRHQATVGAHCREGAAGRLDLTEAATLRAQSVQIDDRI